MIVYKEEPLTNEMKARIDQGFFEFATTKVGGEDKSKPIAFVAYESEDTATLLFAGVVCAQLFWGQLHIKYTYIAPAFRNRGIGTKLIEMALDYGRKHACDFVFVETMSFQAPEFYKKLGFINELTRTGFVKGISYHYLKRQL